MPVAAVCLQTPMSDHSQSYVLLCVLPTPRGARNVPGRYSLHFHLVGDAPGAYVKNNAFFNTNWCVLWTACLVICSCWCN